MTPILIDQPEQLSEVSVGLQGADVLFVDTEFESRRGGTDLCLVQVTDGEQLYLIDTVELGDISSLADVLAHRDVTWVMHAGRQDVDLLMKALRLRRRPAIYDTQAWSLVSATSGVPGVSGRRAPRIHREKRHQTDNYSVDR